MNNIFFHLGTREPDYRSLMREQQDFVLAGQSIRAHSLVICEQTHTNLVHRCGEEDSGAGLGGHPQIPIADGLVTNIPGQFLLIRTADCYPVLFYDQQALVVAAVHSGREGTRKNIVEQAVNTMVKHYGSDPQHIIAQVGAGVCEQHYEVSAELWNQFNAHLQQQDFCPCTNKYRHLNLRTTIFQQLIRAGLKFINIENVQLCTYESPHYFSYRRDKGNNRQINLIGITNE